MRHRTLSLLLLVLTVGCGNSSVGSPCDKDEQCGEDLICDFHDGKGTCQEPHGHGSAGEGSGGDASSGSDGPTTGGTTHEHESHGHGTTAGASTTGSAEEICADYCACLAMHCAQHDQFPHADAAACEAACAGFSAQESACWIPYCELAAKGDASQVHYCEHASGSIGLAECE